MTTVLPADNVGPNVLNAWIHGDLLTVNMLGMAHPEFSSMFQRRESAQRFAENQVADYGREDANTSYAWVALYTLNFLDAYLKHDASAKAFLEKTPAENGVPKHFMGIKFSAAQSNPVQTSGNRIWAFRGVAMSDCACFFVWTWSRANYCAPVGFTA